MLVEGTNDAVTIQPNAILAQEESKACISTQ
jgi:hypothetical protein